VLPLTPPLQRNQLSSGQPHDLVPAVAAVTESANLPRVHLKQVQMMYTPQLLDLASWQNVSGDCIHTLSHWG